MSATLWAPRPVTLETIGELRREAFDYESNSDWPVSEYHLETLFDLAEQALREGSWTYCSDRQPERPYRDYLVSLLDGQGKPMTCEAQWDGSEWKSSDGQGWSREDIYAWRPLPSPAPLPEERG